MFHKKGRNRLRDFREMGNELSGKAKDKFHQFREEASDFYQASLRRTSQWRGELEDYIREYPLRSVLIAAGVGLLVAMAVETLRRPTARVKVRAQERED